MSHLTTDSTLDYLAEFIEEYAGFGDGGDHIGWLAKQTDYVEKQDTHNTCRHCGADVSRHRFDDEVEITCHDHPNNHTYRLNPEEVFAYQLNPDSVLRDIAAELGFGNSVDSVAQNPEYAVTSVTNYIRIALLLRPRRHEKVVDELFADSVKNGRVNALFTSSDFEDVRWGSVLRKPLAGAAPVFPLRLLPNSADEIQRQLTSASEARQRNELTLPSGDTDLIRNLNQNPRATQFELEYAPLFRASDTPDSTRLGDRFEDVCTTAFGLIGFPTDSDELGTNNRGQNLSDILFTVANDSRYPKNHGGGKILGIVDAKSNAKADIGGEQIVEKHAEYLQQANTDAFDEHHIAHVFVVLSMKGYESNEVNWYDAIEANFHGENVDDITMVVLYADALSHMLDIQISATQRNEASLAVGDIDDVFRPFFNYRAFKRGLDEDIRDITRVDDRDPNAYEKGYRDEYHKRERLLVITREMVDKHYRRTIEDHNMIGGLLSRYGDTL